MIRAEAYSDDRVFEVEFDATLWFQRASQDEIVALAHCEMWGGDYPADEVAYGMEAEVRDLGHMLAYCTRKEDCGFECYVNRDDAVEWLKANRPEIYAAIEPILEEVRL